MVPLQLFLVVVSTVGVVFAIAIAALYRLNKAVDQSEPEA
jgi:hypothetical protein